MPMLEEMDYVPTTRYAFGEEIRLHLEAIADEVRPRRRRAVPHRRRPSEWDESTLAVGDPHRPRRRGPLPLLRPGGGHPQPHEAAGDPRHGGVRGQGVPHRALGLRLHRRRRRTTRLTKLGDKVVGLIGTGASGIQCLPPLAESAKHVYVFQRTPSAIGERGNRPTDDDFAEQLQPGWQKERMDNFQAVMIGRPVERDLVDDGWTQHTTRRPQPAPSKRA